MYDTSSNFGMFRNITRIFKLPEIQLKTGILSTKKKRFFIIFKSLVLYVEYRRTALPSEISRKLMALAITTSIKATAGFAF